jgi:hypothetical protein
VARIFLGFARFPAASVSRDRAGSTLVSWSDVRFIGGGLPTFGEPTRNLRSAFAAAVLIDSDGRIAYERLGAGRFGGDTERVAPSH